MRIVTRGQWGHPGPLGPPMRVPARRLYVHHSVTARRNGIAAVRHIAEIGIGRFGRSSYSYALTPDGTVYELQGSYIGAHAAGQNSTSLAVVLVGNYETDSPSVAQVTAVADLYRDRVAADALAAAAALLGHRDAPGASTACPGRHAYAALPAIRMAIAVGDTDEEDDMIEYGDRGNSVTRLQWRINELIHGEADPRGQGKTYGLVVDGHFGDDTLAYTHEVQKRLGDRKYPGRVSAALLLQLHDKTAHR